MGKAKLIYYLKEEIKEKYIMELVIYSVDDKRYHDGIKYSLMMMEMKTGKRVLMDNHHPKEHHFHFDNQEFAYQYQSNEILLEDFRRLVLQHFGEKI